MFNLMQVEFNIKLTAFFCKSMNEIFKISFELSKRWKWFIALHFNEDLSPLIKQY